MNRKFIDKVLEEIKEEEALESSKASEGAAGTENDTSINPELKQDNSEESNGGANDDSNDQDLDNGSDNTDASESAGEKSENNTQSKKKSEYTKEEKAEYAFKKNLRKQKEKFDATINSLQEEIKSLKERIEKPETYLGEEHYVSKEDYLKETLGKMLKSELDKKALEQKEFELTSAVAQERKEIISRRLEENFPDVNERKAFQDKIREATQKGFKVDNDTMTFCDNSPIGPRILEVLIESPDTNSYLNKLTPVVKAAKLIELQNLVIQELSSKRQVSKPENKNKYVPVLGKLGGQGRPESSGSNQKSEDQEILALVKRRR